MTRKVNRLTVGDFAASSNVNNAMIRNGTRELQECPIDRFIASDYTRWLIHLGSGDNQIRSMSIEHPIAKNETIRQRSTVNTV
jgi:hypothetical protein